MPDEMMLRKCLDAALEDFAKALEERNQERRAHNETQRDLESLRLELAETRAKLEQSKQLHASCREMMGRMAGNGITTHADRAVLDAMRDQDQQELEWCADPCNSSIWREQSVAELARRGEKPFAGVRASDWLRELREEDEEKP